MSTCRSQMWRDGTSEAEDFPLEQAIRYIDRDDCLVWLDLASPDEDEIGVIARKFDLDPHAIEDAMSKDERPKASREDGRLFLTASPVRYDANAKTLERGRVSVFSTEHAVITVRLDDILDVDAVRRRWRDDNTLVRAGPLGLLHGLLDEIVDHYLDVLDLFDRDMDEIEHVLFDERAQASDQLSRRTFVLRRALVDARRAIAPTRDLISTVRTSASKDAHAEQLGPYYADLSDHIVHAAESIEALRDSTTSVLDVSNSLSDTRMNTIMKKLTAWAAIIAVPTAISGFYGQNVPYPGFGHAWGFWLSTALTAIIAVAIYISFRGRNWL